MTEPSSPSMYEEGRKAKRDYLNSTHYLGFTRTLSAEDGMKIFLPPIPQSMMAMSTPLPKDRQQWIKGWNHEE